MDVDAVQGEGQWKRKYYDQLDRLEKKEKQWGELEAVLKKAVGRLSLAAEGQADSIDRYLKDIRVAVKGDVDHFRLESILEDLSKRLAKIDEPNKRIVGALRELLEPLDLPESCEKSRQKILKQLKKATDNDKDKSISVIQKILNKAISIEPVKEVSKTGMLGRILGKPESTEDADELAANQEDTEQPDESADVVSRAIGEIELELAFEENPSSGVSELLVRLLEQLVVPADFYDKIEAMKVRIAKSESPSEWELLKDAARLINSIPVHMQEEKNEFENFLHQVTSKLNEMDDFLVSEGSAIDSAEKEGMLFDDNVKMHVKDICNDVKDAGSLEDLKVIVEGRIENISHHIKEYRSAENERFSLAKKDIVNMQNQMMALEKESEVLKAVIVEKNKLAMFDALTCIPNRLAYEKKTVKEIARWKRFGNALSLIVWDIDLFKKVNDTYGHKAGDKVLKTIAQLMNSRIRETDFLARYGGEEFVMLLPGTTEEEALRVANDLRTKVESCGFHYQGKAVNINVSCGISSFSANDTQEKVFGRADQALYHAKENGRNQCVLASAA